jgi:hypothetical protein
MVGGVAGDELIEERRSNVGVQARDKTCAGTDEVGLDVLKTRRTVAPKGIRDDGAPGIVDITEGKAVVVR